MLTSPSFKLQKLTRSMEFKSTSLTKDSLLSTPRISAMNSISKSIKYNNLSFITGEELCKLRREPEQNLDDPEYSDSKNNMVHMRKRYDQVSQQKLYYENKIARLTEERNKYKTQEAQYENNKKNGKNTVIDLESEIERMKLLLLDKEFQKMSMEQMIEVIKHDKVVYDKRKFDLEKQLKKLKIDFKKTKQFNLSKKQQDDRTNKVYGKLVLKLSGENKEREEHLNSIEQRIILKESLNNSSVLRKSQIEAIAEKAMCERDPQEKQWLKIWSTHKLLEKMLQSKMEREMHKFSVVEQAFKKIKIQTGVSDVQTMVQKYLSKQQIYGDLLSKIAENQKSIESLKAQQQKYLKEIKKSEQQINLFQIIKSNQDHLHVWTKQADFYRQKKKNCDYQQQKLKLYLLKQYKILSKNTQLDKSKKFKLHSKDQIKSAFIDYLTWLSKLAEETHKIQVQSENTSETDLNFSSEEVQKKLFRISAMAKVTPNTSYNTTNNDKNVTFDEQVQNNDEEEVSKIIDEKQAMEHQRQSMLKSNEKFMKDLKMRKEQQKRIMIQTLVKNTKEKPAPIQVKKVEQPQE